MRIFLLCTALLIADQLCSQQIKYENTIGWRGNRIELHTISDRTKQQACMFVANTDSIRAFLLNEKAEVVQQHNFVRHAGEEVLGGFVKENKIYFFVNNIKTDELHNRVFNMQTGDVSEHLVPFDLKKEKIIERISCGNHFLFFTVSKKTSELIIYDFYSESQFNTFRHKFEEDIWTAITRANGWSRAVNVQKVDMEGECAVDVAAWKNKVYFDNDTLYLVINSSRNISKIYCFDLVNQKVDSRLVHHTMAEAIIDPLGYSENSFLFNKKLYFVHATSDNLSVQIIDIFSGNVLKKYDAKKNDEISFKNTPIMQEGESMAKNAVRELGKTRQLLRKMSLASAVIIATPNDSNQVDISIGSYQQVSSGGSMMMPGLMGGAIGGAMAGTFIYVNVGGFSRSNWTKSARFRMRVDADNFDHIPGDMGMTINEKIEVNTKDVKIPPEAENLFVIDHTSYHAYYNRKERKLVVVKY